MNKITEGPNPKLKINWGTKNIILPNKFYTNN